MFMSSKYNAIHFDMDGVIADTEAFHVAAEQQTCLDYEFAIDPAQWGGFKGRTATDIFNHLIERYGDPQVHDASTLIAHKTDVFINLLNGKLAAIDGVLDFLAWSRANHSRMSLVTSSNKRVQSFITESLGIADLFDIVITGDDITEGKPSPQPYLKALGELGVKGEDSIVIEDSKSGILSAKAALCSVLGITTSHPRSELESVGPTYIADCYEQARLLLSA
jgi:HAD superfamily hydrolase (TIGR01509 family)